MYYRYIETENFSGSSQRLLDNNEWNLIRASYRVVKEQDNIDENYPRINIYETDVPGNRLPVQILVLK